MKIIYNSRDKKTGEYKSFFSGMDYWFYISIILYFCVSVLVMALNGDYDQLRQDYVSIGWIVTIGIPLIPLYIYPKSKFAKWLKTK